MTAWRRLTLPSRKTTSFAPSEPTETTGASLSLSVESGSLIVIGLVLPALFPMPNRYSWKTSLSHNAGSPPLTQQRGVSVATAKL